MRFLTGCVKFSMEPLSQRPIANYKRLLFIEHWCQGPEESVLLLGSVLSGQAEIAGQRIATRFSTSTLDHQTYPMPPDFWARWELKSAVDHDPGSRDLYLPQGTLSGIGLATYLGPSEAINDWVFGLETSNNLGSDVPYKDYLVTVLPDTRARFLSAEWLPGSLHLEVEVMFRKMICAWKFAI
jgi:hypothetical protein